MKIRCVVAYGPQENESLEKKEFFWEHLDKKVDEAEKAGAGFILQFDGNLWAGNKLIPGDPRPQNKNGQFFEQFLIRNPRLSIVNSLPLCEGLVTRSRNKNGVLEESVLDFFVVCSSVLPFVTKMVIDEEKKHILTNYKAAKTAGKAVDSDHYTEYLDINIEIVKEKPDRQEIFDFKDKKSQEAFKTNTSETMEFTNCFDGKETLMEKIEKWTKVLNSHCSKAFKKIRLNDKKTKPISKNVSKLINERNKLAKMGCVCEKTSETKSYMKEPRQKHVGQKLVCEECGKQMIGLEKLRFHMNKHNIKRNSNFGTKKQFLCDLCDQHFSKKQYLLKHITEYKKESSIKCKECGKSFKSHNILEEHSRVHKKILENECDICSKEIILKNLAIAEEEALENRKKIIKQFKYFSDNPEGIKMQKMWKVLKKICPKLKSILPSAKKNHRGKIVSSKSDIKNLLATEYRNRLRSRPYLNDLIATKLRRKKLFNLKLKLAELNKTPIWTMKDLERALDDLKRNKSRDSEGLVNEIFKNDVIGSDLKQSLLLLYNSIKKENFTSKFIKQCEYNNLAEEGP